MSLLLGELLRRFWPWLAGAGVVGAAMVALGLHLRHDHRTAVALDRARLEADRWARAYGSEKAAFDQAEGLRRREGTAARAAAESAARQCSARVAEARRSALAIHDIVSKEVPHDPQGCPVRVLVDPGRLRDALQPARARH